jgi:uncharacterized repeat protein (TIGR01451 family)
MLAFSCIFASAAALVNAPQTSFAQTHSIGGVVFNDANANGTRDAGEGGLADVTVTAYAAGTTASATQTGSDGRYTLTISSNRARVEFTGWAAPYQSSRFGANSGTSVQFVDVPASEVNLGLFDPAQYCQSNARIIGNCFVFGDNVNGRDNAFATVRSFPFDVSGINPSAQTAEATARQTGATYGVAYQRSTRNIFVSAYTKRAASFGPGTGQGMSDGTGTIYRIPFDGTPKDAVPFLDLDALVGTDVTGANPHTDLRPDAPDFDSGAFDAVGKVAFGDMEMGEDDATLWVMNLKLRALVRIPIGYNAQVPPASQLGNYFVPEPSCPNGAARPFAIKPYGSLIYVGGVCTAENGGSANDLSAYVYAFNPNNSTWAGPVLQVPLNYSRGCADIFATYPITCRVGTNGTSAAWSPWRDTVNAQFPNGFEAGFTSHATPMLTDIEFVGTDMVLGFRDRFADQIGYIDPGPFGAGYRNPYNPSDTTVYDLRVIPGGDVLRASRVGSGLWQEGQWQIENNARGGGFGPSAGANNNEGPGGGEFYFGDLSVIDGKTVHDESALGALAQLPGSGELLTTAADPVRLFTGGVAWLNNSTGARTRSYEMYAPDVPGTYRKTNGMGDIEVLCDAAPLEIGNRVWLDSNGDGVQDPTESPIPNVLVKKTDANGATETAVTNAKGEYYFAALPGQPYVLSVELDQRALTDLKTTQPNADRTANGDARDSDGLLEGALSVIRLQTGGPGAVNHTYDFGFAPELKTPQVTPRLTLQKLVNDDDANNPTGPMVTVGSVVTWTYKITNSGDVTLTNVYVTDDKEGLICSGITLAPGESTTCSRTGIAVAGQYVNTGIVTGTNAISVSQFVTATDLAHYVGVVLPKPAIKIKKYTNGADADVPPGPAVLVGSVVTWTYEVQNTGNVTLTNVVVNDDVIGPIACPKMVLAPGETMLCTKTGIATLGQYRNVGTATGVNQLVPSESVSSTDVSHYLGAQDLPAGLGDYVWLDANRDGLQGANEQGIAGVVVVLYNAGSTPSLRPILTTTTNAQGYYSFTQLLPGSYLVGFVPPRNYLLTMQGQDDTRADDSNADVLSGLTRPVTLAAGEFNPTIDAGLFTTHPAIVIKKFVNGQDADTAPGPTVLTTVPVTWTYIITNTGDVTLTRISLSDDKLGKVICPLTELPPGQSMLCTATGNAVAGQYANLGTVTGYDQLISNCVYPSACDVVPLTASDPAHYFGAGPQLVIVKSVTPAAPAPVTPGQILTYTLRITNTGNFTTTGVMVRDYIPVGATYVEGSARPPVVSGPNPLVWSLGTLGISQSMTVSFAVRVRNELTVTAIVNRAQAWSAELGIVESNLVASVLAQTAVTLSDFRVVREGDANTVVWQTSGEANTFGFAIYRAEDENRANAVLISKEMLAAKGAGNGYTFVDVAAQSGTLYRYWLVEVETDGRMNEYGPIMLSTARALPVPAPVAGVAVAAGGVPGVVLVAQPGATAPQVLAEVAPIAQTQTQVDVDVSAVVQDKPSVVQMAQLVGVQQMADEMKVMTSAAAPQSAADQIVVPARAPEQAAAHTNVDRAAMGAVADQNSQSEAQPNKSIVLVSMKPVDTMKTPSASVGSNKQTPWQRVGKGLLLSAVMGLIGLALVGMCLGVAWRLRRRRG